MFWEFLTDYRYQRVTGPMTFSGDDNWWCWWLVIGACWAWLLTDCYRLLTDDWWPSSGIFALGERRESAVKVFTQKLTQFCLEPVHNKHTGSSEKDQRTQERRTTASEEREREGGGGGTTQQITDETRVIGNTLGISSSLSLPESESSMIFEPVRDFVRTTLGSCHDASSDTIISRAGVSSRI